MNFSLLKHAATAAIAAAAIGAAAPASAQDCRRAIESGFSYCLPDGWTAKAGDQQKFKVYLAPPGETFTPNVNFNEVDDTRSLADWVALNVKTMTDDPKKMGATSFRVLGQSDFATTSGERGTRVAMDISTAQVSVRLYQYYFSGRAAKKYLASCIGLQTLQSLESTCDRMFRTFRLDP